MMTAASSFREAEIEKQRAKFLEPNICIGLPAENSFEDFLVPSHPVPRVSTAHGSGKFKREVGIRPTYHAFTRAAGSGCHLL